jgi:hypothetical protein
MEFTGCFSMMTVIPWANYLWMLMVPLTLSCGTSKQFQNNNIYNLSCYYRSFIMAKKA